MPYLSLAFLIFHIYIMVFVGKILERKTTFRGFTLLLVLSPLNISLTLFFAAVIGLSPQELGMTIGNFAWGISFVGLSIPLALISFYSILRAPAVWIMRIRYGNVSRPVPQLVYSWLVVGIVEELLYRGFFQGSLSKHLELSFLTVEVSTVIASFVFVFVHLGNVLMKAETFRNFRRDFLPRLLASFILGYTFQISHSLLYPIIIHNLIDGLTLTGLIYRKKQILKANHEILFKNESDDSSSDE